MPDSSPHPPLAVPDATDLRLNDAQRAAVEHPAGPLLVVAGAGSGKTRVLTARVAWLLGRGVPPHAILAFTFTNRAAREMRERIARAAGEAARSIWIGTFHSTAVRILRRDGEAIGIARDFAIYDRDDQESVVREVVQRLELPESEFKTGAVLARISDAKNALVDPGAMDEAAVGPRARRMAECYRLYQQTLEANGALDFDDLIVRVVRLLREVPEVGRRYAERFQHVLVDEYQDTNHAQFRLVESLTSVHGNLFAVGDDDQSIYGWRGANPSHVLDFEHAYPGAARVRLEQNYRSTGAILEAANAVIARNRTRGEKTLWCDRERGSPVRFVLAEDEADEARRVRGFLAEHVRGGGRLDDCAVLYRTNAQSRALETELRRHLVAYEIVGGVPFYQRREVKDLLAYLRLAINPADAVAFWRAWNTPRRGLGPATRALVERRMEAGRLAPAEALRSVAESEPVPRSARAGAIELLGVLDELRESAEAPVPVALERLVARIGYLEHLAAEEDGQDRIANVAELANAAAGFAEAGRGTLRDFLAEAALVSDADLMSETADRVLLLTAHNAKGLEFPVVIVTGLEEGLFPHANAAARDDLEEERRLFYVALTRARDRVFLTAAAYRRRHDGARGGAVSRFVGEIPAAVLETEEAPRARRGGDGARGRSFGSGGPGRSGRRDAEEASSHDFATGAARAYHPAIGREVYHESWGRGVVLGADPHGEDVKYTVRFGTTIKKVMGRYLVEGGHGD